MVKWRVKDFGGVCWFKQRKVKYWSREEGKLIQGAILWLARFFAVECFPESPKECCQLGHWALEERVN